MKATNDTSLSEPADLLAATDQCVLCGLCLPHCPTYDLTLNEADSPRGRITLIQGLLRGDLKDDEVMRRHLDGCLVCRACEDVCPSGVPYGRIIDGGRHILRTQPLSTNTYTAMLDYFTTSRGFRRALYGTLRLAGKIGINRWLPIRAKVTSPFSRLSRIATRIPSAPLPFSNPRIHRNKRVYLFTGCAGEVFDRETLRSSSQLLKALGYEVLAPKQQTCCGALHQHSGDLDTAARLAGQNIAAFNEPIPIVSTSSACAATLHEYGNIVGQRGRQMGERSQEICTFLASISWLGKLQLRPLHGRAVVHIPCTQKYVLHEPEAGIRLLKKIPGLEVLDLPGNDRCCGAAGRYMLDHPQIARQLAAPKIKAIQELVPDWLVSTNIGCTLHLGAELSTLEEPMTIIHPVTLLARQLEQTSVTTA